MAALSRAPSGLTGNRQAFVGGSRAARGRVTLAIPHATALPAEVRGWHVGVGCVIYMLFLCTKLYGIAGVDIPRTMGVRR